MIQLYLRAKKASTDLSDMVSVVATSLLLVIFLVLFLVPGVMNEQKQEINVREDISNKINLFVLNSFLQTPIDESYQMSDLINWWLLDDEYTQKLKNEIDSSLGIAYGSCYGLKIDTLEMGGLDEESMFCLDYPNFGDKILICLDISQYNEKFTKGEEQKCF